MSLSTLINGADCGPVNPLQGLAKRFDNDRGKSQDQFGSGRAGPSREAFRSAPAPASPAFIQEATQFFHGDGTPRTAQQAPFDLSSLNAALSTPSSRESPSTGLATTHSGVSSWASDFSVSIVPKESVLASAGWARDFSKQPTPTAMAKTEPPQPAQTISHSPQVLFQRPQFHMQPPAFPPFPPGPQLPHVHVAHFPMERQTALNSSQWESQFHDVETRHQTTAPDLSADDLASTAGLLLESLKSERNEKFKKSAFMGLMRQVRDHQVVVSGNDLVSASEVNPGPFSESNSYEASQLAKGKMKETDLSSSAQRRKSVHFGSQDQVSLVAEEDLLDREPDVAEGASSARAKTRRIGIIEAQEAEWAQLQHDWDDWEATSVGFQKVVPPVANSYQFRANNPYMNREYTRMQHVGMQRSISQTVLEKEAHVQQNLYDAQAWLDLGIKQQENEREAKAIVALKRALELDETLLPAYISLATSYTNEGNRHDAYNALAQWVENNERYKIITAKYRLSSEETDHFVSMRERRDRLVDCLIEMATRAHEVGVQAIDADVQIALAVLLNTSEDYAKSLDCFQAALEARPDDWVLYNRVGATLANSGMPEEALAYYHRALEFNSSYIRARYNLGVSCISLKRYEEAASYILDALVLQEGDSTEDDARGVTSSSLWDLLRTASHHMSRRDLADLCDRRDLDGFRGAFQQ